MPFFFNYTCYEQQITLKPGKWFFECWGASGGSSTGIGGKGAYASAVFVLNSIELFYLYVGEEGKVGALRKSFNGGGKDTKDYNDRQAASGGGGTDVRLKSVDGNWSNYESLKSRVLIAGGGGGASFYLTGAEARGGDAGALIGMNGSFSQCDLTVCTDPDPYYNATGGTDKEGGKGGYYDTYHSSRIGSNGELGIGGDACTLDTGAGGGGGYYGGGGGGTVHHRVGSGGGGSSFAYHPGEIYPDRNFYLQKVTIKGGDKTIISPEGFVSIGNTGNGFIRISPFSFFIKTCKTKNILIYLVIFCIILII